MTDLKTLTDAELEDLQLAVNAELGERLLRSRMARRVARIITEAEDQGVPAEEIEVALSDARVIAQEHKKANSDDSAAEPDEKFTTTSASAGASGSPSGNTIGKNTK